MTRRIRGRVVRVAVYHGEEIGPGVYAPSPLDEVDAELEDGTVTACYRCEVDEVDTREGTGGQR